MANGELNVNEADDRLRIEQLPKTALQAIYHAVTGKTESLTKSLSGNVIVKSEDIDQLFLMIVDQTNHYSLKFNPTVTVVVKCENEKSIVYSSWEKYQALRVSNHDVTSQVSIKFEFVMRLPNTELDQRFTINVSIDSALPVFSSEAFQERLDPGFGAFFILNNPWRTIEISIDFVDFLVAKIFCGVVEEWFSRLQKSTQPKFNEIMLNNFSTISSTMGQFGRIGMATFLLSYALLMDVQSINLWSTIVAVAIGLLIWSSIIILDNKVTKVVFSRISRNIIPTVVLLNESDRTSYDKLLARRNSAFNTVVAIAASGLFAVSMNILASYIYSAVSG